MINETINLPISFIIGVSFISGSVIGGILSPNILNIKKIIKVLLVSHHLLTLISHEKLIMVQLS